MAGIVFLVVIGGSWALYFLLHAPAHPHRPLWLNTGYRASVVIGSVLFLILLAAFSQPGQNFYEKITKLHPVLGHRLARLAIILAFICALTFIVAYWFYAVHFRWLYWSDWY